jgi:hypothetical protein
MINRVMMVCSKLNKFLNRNFAARSRGHAARAKRLKCLRRMQNIACATTSPYLPQQEFVLEQT